MEKKIDSKQIKETAWHKMSDKWLFGALSLLLFYVLVLIPSIPNTFTDEGSTAYWCWYIVNFTVSTALEIGLLAIFCEVSWNGKKSYKSVFVGFTRGFEYFGKVVVANLLVAVFTLLWSLLLIVPGIMKMFSYSQTWCILLDHPEYSIMQAISESKKIMQGHRLELFALFMRFTPWMLLFLVSLGLAGFWVIPYMLTAFAEFYLQLKKKQQTTDEKLEETVQKIAQA